MRLKTSQGRSNSTLVVDRNFNAVLSNTDVAVVMEKGQIVQSGSAAALLASPDQLTRYLGV